MNQWWINFLPSVSAFKRPSNHSLSCCLQFYPCLINFSSFFSLINFCSLYLFLFSICVLAVFLPRSRNILNFVYLSLIHFPFFLSLYLSLSNCLASVYLPSYYCKYLNNSLYLYISLNIVCLNVYTPITLLLFAIPSAPYNLFLIYSSYCLSLYLFSLSFWLWLP